MSLFQTFLDQLATVLEFPSLVPDRSGACLIVMKEDQLNLLFEFDDRIVPNMVLLSSPIGPAPKNLLAALQANLTQEETLSYHEETLYLHRRFNPLIQAADLKPLMEAFLQHVRSWQKKKGEENATPSEAPKPHHLKV